jgi:phage terminase large subunit GpA-like protein
MVKKDLAYKTKTTENPNDYLEQFIDLFKGSSVSISDIKPSEWVQQNVVMGKPFPGPFSYNRTPYCREIIDRFANDNPMKWLAIMKGAQIGLSAGVLIPCLLWMIKNDPSNSYFLVGSPDLIEKATEKLDIGIDNAGLRPYIKPQVQRKRAQKSGDTNTKKEFAGGYIHIGSANNHKDIRDVSLKYGLFDDFESVKSKSKESGSTRKLLEQRFAAYEDSHKICYCSTPELDESSNIKEAYLLGDQRKYFIPCPCCGIMIDWHWTITKGDITGGITWKLDDKGKVISSSVGYVCQECGGFFDDKNKNELLNLGEWQPTCEPSKPGYYSYHISSLYAPIGMYGWEHYVNDWIEANPVGQPRKEDLYKTFVNVVLGETYETPAEELSATELQMNIRDYEIGVIPERMSENDGNGAIVFVTLGADMNGKPDDARLDYEIVAWSESGASYSINHGSIGTFVPREGQNGIDRERWTYQHGMERSVWTELDRIISEPIPTDSGNLMQIMTSGIDCGYLRDYAYQYIDSKDFTIVGLKGKDTDKYTMNMKDAKSFKQSLEKPNLYMVETNLTKDRLASKMRLKWSDKMNVQQPSGFMNFPTPSGGKYLFNNYFSHYEAEHRILDKTNTFKWEKKNDVVQNHLFDCRLYAGVVGEVMVARVFKELKIVNGTWKNYCDIVLDR